MRGVLARTLRPRDVTGKARKQRRRPRPHASATAKCPCFSANPTISDPGKSDFLLRPVRARTPRTTGPTCVETIGLITGRPILLPRWPILLRCDESATLCRILVFGHVIMSQFRTTRPALCHETDQLSGAESTQQTWESGILLSLLITWHDPCNTEECGGYIRFLREMGYVIRDGTTDFEEYTRFLRST